MTPGSGPEYQIGDRVQPASGSVPVPNDVQLAPELRVPSGAFGRVASARRTVDLRQWLNSAGDRTGPARQHWALGTRVATGRGLRGESGSGPRAASSSVPRCAARAHR